MSVRMTSSLEFSGSPPPGNRRAGELGGGSVGLAKSLVSVTEGSVSLKAELRHARCFRAGVGEIMTLLIALEFNHTLQYVISRDRGIVQGKVIVLIAQLALARKVIVTDPYEVAPASVAALAGLALALGVTYWLMRGRDGDLEAAEP